MSAISPSATQPGAGHGGDPIRALLDGFDAKGLGSDMHRAVRALFPIPRSITGDGLRHSLRFLQRLAPLALREVPTGTRVLDWVIPKEWNVAGARLRGPDGEVLADFESSPLHLLGYSVPFRGKVSLEELQPHLHSLPDQPSLIPYRTRYYQEDWGFCLPHEQRARLGPGLYDVAIETSLTDGALTYGELVRPGRSGDEVLLSAHCCHPSLANDNLTGMVLGATLARLLQGAPLRYTYRFLFAPGTIGAIAWLAANEERAGRIKHGLVLACLGDTGRLTYKRSRNGEAEIDRAVAHVLARGGDTYEIRDFTPYGYDERQFCSPGFDLPVGSLSRTPYGEYPEYHTSADDLDFVKPDRLADSLRRILEVIEVLEGNATGRNLSPKGEPQLGRRGLYGAVGGQSHAAEAQMALLWVLNQSDGTRSLLDIAERAKLPFAAVRQAARALHGAGLLALGDDTPPRRP